MNSSWKYRCTGSNYGLDSDRTVHRRLYRRSVCGGRKSRFTPRHLIVQIGEAVDPDGERRCPEPLLQDTVLPGSATAAGEIRYQAA